MYAEGAEGIRRGSTLVTAVCLIALGGAAKQSLIVLQSTFARARADYERAGWKTFDPDAPPHIADQVRRERNLYGRWLLDPFKLSRVDVPGLTRARPSPLPLPALSS